MENKGSHQRTHLLEEEIKMNENDALIGAKVRENREKRRERSKKMYPIWLREGQSLKTQREAMRVSQEMLAKRMHVSVKLIRKIERGFYIQRRDPIIRSYQLALENISMADREAFRILDAR